MFIQKSICTISIYTKMNLYKIEFVQNGFIQKLIYTKLIHTNEHLNKNTIEQKQKMYKQNLFIQRTRNMYK